MRPGFFIKGENAYLLFLIEEKVRHTYFFL